MGIKGQYHMFGVTIFSTQKMKQKNNFLGISGSSPHFFFDWRSKFIFEKCIRNTFQIRGDNTQREQNSLKTKKNLSINECNWSYCLFQYHILKKHLSLTFSFKTIHMNVSDNSLNDRMKNILNHCNFRKFWGVVCIKSNERL